MRVLGEQVAAAPGYLFQNRDCPMLDECRSVPGGLFERLYGLSPTQVRQVFTGARPCDIALV